jgi:hypothetical protein
VAIFSLFIQQRIERDHEISPEQGESVGDPYWVGCVCYCLAKKRHIVRYFLHKKNILIYIKTKNIRYNFYSYKEYVSLHSTVACFAKNKFFILLSSLTCCPNVGRDLLDIP